MAIKLLTKPPLVSLANSPIFYRFEGENYLFSAGKKHNSELSFNANPANGQSLIFSYKSKYIQLFFRTTPNTSGSELLAGSVADINFWPQLALSLQQNFDLNDEFIFTSSIAQRKIIIESRNQEEIPLLIEGTSNSSLNTLEVGGAPTTQINYYAALNIYVEVGRNSSGFIYDKIEGLSLTPDEDGVMVLNVASYLRGYLRGEAPISYINYPYLVTSINLLNGRYYVELAEFYGTIPSAQSRVFKTELLNFLKGGLSNAYYADYKDFINDFIIKPNGNTRFVTYRPIVREVTEQQPEWLYFYNGFESIRSIKVFTKVYYTDGNTAQRSTIRMKAAYLHFIVIPTGYSQLALQNFVNPNKDVLKYEVAITDEDDNIVSDIVTYKVIETDYLDEYIIYESSSTSWETLHIYGRTSQGVSVNFEEFKRVLGFDFNEESRQLNNERNFYNERLRVSTGFMSEENMRYITDFLNSENMLLIKGEKRIPVTIQSGEYTLVTKDNHLYSLNFVIKYAYNETNFSAIPS